MAQDVAAESPGLLHLDMDAFFASVEVRDDPSLRGLPVVVGGTGPRAVVAAASYPARRHGIRSAMPMGAARRLAPDLVIVRPRIDHYRQVSREVMDILRSVVAEIEQVSIDEAFLDVRPARRLFGEPADVAALLRRRIREEVGLPSSVGGSVSRPVAKIASARAKPDGMLIVPAAETAAFLAPLPIGAIAGVGPRAVERLERLGIRTIAQLLEVPESTLSRVLGPRAAAVRRLAAGEDRTGLGTDPHDRSLGTERTWDEDVTDPADARRRIMTMADAVARQLRRESLVCRTVVLKLRAPDGTTITRSSTFAQPTDSSDRLSAQVLALWEKERPTMPRLRLAGVRAAHVLPAAGAPAARELSSSGQGWHGVELAWDRASDRFGAGTITRGSLLSAEPRDSDGARTRRDDAPRVDVDAGQAQGVRSERSRTAGDRPIGAGADANGTPEEAAEHDDGRLW